MLAGPCITNAATLNGRLHVFAGHLERYEESDDEEEFPNWQHGLAHPAFARATHHCIFDPASDSWTVAVLPRIIQRGNMGGSDADAEDISLLPPRLLGHAGKLFFLAEWGYDVDEHMTSPGVLDLITYDDADGAWHRRDAFPLSEILAKGQTMRFYGCISVEY